LIEITVEYEDEFVVYVQDVPKQFFEMLAKDFEKQITGDSNGEYFTLDVGHISFVFYCERD